MGSVGSIGMFAVLQVADFNLSRRIQQHTGQMTHSGSINSPQWSAPERLSGDDYSFPADVFSFGVILWELSTLSAYVFFVIHVCHLSPHLPGLEDPTTDYCLRK
jgi:serine/threonine protein kinase